MSDRETVGNALTCAEIPGVGIPVSRVFFGTAIPSMLAGKNENELLDQILALGVNAFDCARGYGQAERSLGSWVRERGNRDKVVILTKCGNINLLGRVHVDEKVIRKELEKSLSELKMDYVDIYLLHRDDPKTEVGEFIEVLNDLKKRGQIRTFGASNWTCERIREANAYAKAHGLEGFSVSSPNFGLARQVQDPWGGECVTISGPENREARDWYTENQMPVLAYSSLGHGFFSGRFRSGDVEGAKRILDGPARKGYLYDVNMRLLALAEKIAERDGCTVSQVAMRYIFSSPMNVFALVSTTSPERMRQNIQSVRWRLTQEDLEILDGEM